MRNLLLALILCCAASGQIPTDNLKAKVAELANVYTKFRDAHPDAQIVRRIENAIHFRMTDGKYTALVGSAMSYVDPDTRELTPIDVDLYQTDAGYRTTGSPITVRVIDGPTISGLATTEVDTYYKNPDTGNVIGYGIAVATATYSGQGTAFTFAQGGIPWTIDLGAFGWDLRGTVAAAQGAKTYRFGYREVNMTLDPDANGNLTTANGNYSISAPVMVRADGVVTPCGGWQQNTSGNLIGFTCDDTGFPAAAYPYVIDPTAVFAPPVTDDGSLNRSGSTWPPTGGVVIDTTTNERAIKDNWRSGSYGRSQVFWRWNTSSIPANAKISAARLTLTTSPNTDWPSYVGTGACTILGDWVPSSVFPLTSADWATTLPGAAYTGPGTAWNPAFGAQNTVALANPSGNVSLTGYTALRFAMIRSSAPPTNATDCFLDVLMSENGVGSTPTLAIDYYIGGPKLIIVNQ